MAGATSPAGASIRAIGRADVQRITSGQVILDIQSATKELIENALDAGATTIEVRFKEHGAETIEVSDNGHGIEPGNYDQLARKHYTSKIATFQDLTSVQTFGFRGEALSSLCELGKVTVLTATKDAQVGTVVELARDGSVASADKKAARSQGTTVTVTDLFHTLPVRRKELLKNVKREFAKTQTLLQAYALVSRGVRWVVSNTVKGKRTPVMTITAATGKSDVAQMRENVTAIFGPKVAAQLTALDVPISLGPSIAPIKGDAPFAANEDEMDEDALTSDDCAVRVTGLVSPPVIGAGRSSSDRSFFYINGRPWDAPKIVRLFNEVYRQYNIQQYPMVIANFHVAGHEVDINVSPDKRTLFLAQENVILEGLRTGLESVFAPFQQSFKVNDLGKVSQARLPYSAAMARDSAEDSSDDMEPNGGSQTVDGGDEGEDATALEQEEDKDEADSGDSLETERTTKRPRFELHAFASSGQMPEVSSQTARTSSHATTVSQFQETATSSTFDLPWVNAGTKRPASVSQRTLAFPSSTQFEESDGEGEVTVSDESMEQERGVAEDDEHTPDNRIDTSVVQSEPVASREAPLDDSSFSLDLASEDRHAFKDEVFGVEVQNGSKIAFDPDAIRASLKASSGKGEDDNEDCNISESFQHLVEEADVGVDSAVAEAALSRIISKTDFGEMRIVGQFNLGFILVRRTLPSGEDDLFIIDQHAADEKYNFETLTATTRLKSQPLIAPRPLQLSPADEFVAVEHGEALAAHGFEVTVNEEAAPGSRIVLQALPMSQHVALGVGDLEELLHRLADERPASDRARTMRVSKVRALLASRACRRSIMIGTALSKTQMQSIVANLGTLDQPWNCPHGRPTMRHLLNLATWSKNIGKHVKDSLSDDNNNEDDITWESLL